MSAARFSLAAAMLFALSPAVAFAAEAPLDASYGNKDGCLYANTGETNGSDNFFLLDKEAITTAASYCEFKTIDSKTADGFDATVTCQEEGSDDSTDLKVKISKAGKDGYKIDLPDGASWGPLKKCK
ncbi:MAG: hypothetical protein BGN83_11060 [Rhizobium sp. 63-7]|nr:MAG: hypothetical protein BGN83_11060 [Rhizobium sp. 63-7]